MLSTRNKIKTKKRTGIKILGKHSKQPGNQANNQIQRTHSQVANPEETRSRAGREERRRRGKVEERRQEREKG